MTHSITPADAVKAVQRLREIAEGHYDYMACPVAPLFATHGWPCRDGIRPVWERLTDNLMAVGVAFLQGDGASFQLYASRTELTPKAVADLNDFDPDIEGVIRRVQRGEDVVEDVMHWSDSECLFWPESCEAIHVEDYEHLSVGESSFTRDDRHITVPHGFTWTRETLAERLGELR